MDTVPSRAPDSDAEAAPGGPGSADFVDCYRTHYRRLIRALRLSGADESTAEDIAQEAFARALVHWRRIRKGPNPPGYMYTTGFRLWQRAQRRPGPPPAQATPPAAPTESVALTVLAVEAALTAMPPRRRVCAVMCLIVGMPISETAVALGIAPGTVRKHLEEARRDLQAACEPPA